MYQGHRTSRGTLGFEPKTCVACVMRSPHAVTITATSLLNNKCKIHRA